MSRTDNLNSNNFILGVKSEKKNNNIINPSNTLINHLKNLENTTKEVIKTNNSNNKNKVNKYGNISKNIPIESFSTVVNDLINKLEEKVYRLNSQIKNFNQEKKSIIELDNKEIKRLQDIIRKTYIMIVTLSKSISLNNSSGGIELLEKIRKTIQENTGLSKNIDEIMAKKKFNFNRIEENNNTRILNIINKTENQIKEENETNNNKKTLFNSVNVTNKEQRVSSLNNFYNNLKNKNLSKNKMNNNQINNRVNKSGENMTPKNNNRVNENSEKMTPKNNNRVNENSENMTPKNNNRVNENSENMTPKNNNRVNENSENMTPKNNNRVNESGENMTPKNNNRVNENQFENIRLNNLNKNNQKTGKKIKEKLENTTITNENAKKKLDQYFL